MQFDQFIRRALWRVQRRLRPGVDNDPIVTVEAPKRSASKPMAPKPMARRGRRRSMALAFVLTFAALAGGYGALVAANSQAPLDTGMAQSGPTLAAADLLSLGADEPEAVADDWLVVPNGRRLRMARIQEGAKEAAIAYVRAAAATDTTDAALRDALLAATERDPAGMRDALLRFDGRVTSGRATPPRVLAALAAAAADACAAEEVALGVAAAREKGWIAGPATQAQFSHARGVAYGWLMLLRGAIAQEGADSVTTAPAAGAALDALSDAAQRAPLVLFNGGVDAPWAPAHVGDMGADLARASAGARALAAAAATNAL